MRLRPVPKRFLSDGQRSAGLAETLKRIAPLCKVAGVTRVADITGLDRVGIPVFSSIRPEAETGAISVYNGKGLTKAQARVSAIMEGLERYSAEVRRDHIERATVEQMMASQNAVDPRALILPQRTAFHVMHQPIAWVRGTELNEQEEIMVPACAVFHPYSSRLDLPLFRSSTNGLASGNTLEEAVLHGLCEVIERDAWSICEARRRVRSDIRQDMKGRVASTLSKFTRKGIEVHLKDITSDVGIPVFAAAADDVPMQDPALLTLGIGCHLNVPVTALKALVEVAQSRLTQIHGAREDTVKADANRRLGYERMKRMNALWFGESGSARPLSEIPSLDSKDFLADIDLVLERLRERGLRTAIAVDLTRQELDVPVVRIIVPGLEIYAIDEERAGRRITEAE
jgi:putative methanogenesis marker protein 1